MKIERMQLPPIYTGRQLKDQIQREIASEIVGSVDADAGKNDEFQQSQFEKQDAQEKEPEDNTSDSSTLPKNSSLNIVV